jgi:hypothetical protein
MAHIAKILAILILFSTAAFSMAASGEGKIHDHQQTKDHIKRDKSPAGYSEDDCMAKPGSVGSSDGSQAKSKADGGAKCEPDEKKKIHDHRKSKNL